VVEFGLSIAALAFVVLLGFQALGGAQATYWGAPAQRALAEPTPVRGDFIHPTSTNASCSPTAGPILAGMSSTFTCSVIVTDVWTSNRSSPLGTVQVTLGSRSFPTCTLSPASFATSTCSINQAWSPTWADIGTQTWQVVYNPSDNHDTSSFNQPGLVINNPLSFTGSDCRNPNNLPKINGGEQMEPGQTLLCTVKVNDLTNTGYNSGVTVSLRPNIALQGTTFLYCYSNNSLTTLAACPAAAENASSNCTTDGTGTCKLMYRRSWNQDNISMHQGLENLTVGLAPPASLPLTPINVPIWDTTSLAAHEATIITDCSTGASNPVTNPVKAWSNPANSLTVLTLSQFTATAASTVTCSATVFDVHLNPAIIQYGCGGTDCNVDDNDSFPPLGSVLWMMVGPTGPVPLPQSGCNGPGGALDYLNTANRPASIPPHFAAQPEYAAWCTAQITLPNTPGAIQVYAAYSGDVFPPGGPAHQPAASQAINVTLN
jgi:hypothetical protein